MTRGSVFLGIDISKVGLDIAVRPSDTAWHERHNPDGIARLVRRIARLRPTLVVLEATGGLEMPLACALGVAGLPVAVVNPR